LLDPSAFTLAITTCESHRIAQDILGRAPSPGQTIVPIDWAARVSFDFAAIAGTVVAP
jgi:hypothetical protein